MTYVIGEIGQNHNGSVDIAKTIIDVVARPVHDKLFGKELPRMDAVKLTKRDLKPLYSGQTESSFKGFNQFALIGRLGAN